MRFSILLCLLLHCVIVSRSSAAEVVAPASEAPAQAESSEHLLNIIDEAGVKHAIDREAFLRLPRQSANVKSRDMDAGFQGASLVDLLNSVGVKFGSDLRGKRTPTVAIFEATDGYRVVLSLVEIDPSTTDRLAVVADEQDGKPLDARLGPYRLVIPGDKREVRWIRNVRTIRVVNLVDFPLAKALDANTTSRSTEE
jgi:hypothetical protein